MTASTESTAPPDPHNIDDKPPFGNGISLSVSEKSEEKVKVKFHYLDRSILEQAAGILKPQPEADLLDSVKKFMEKFSGIGQFYVHFGGAGDALLLLSTFYDDSPEQTIVSISPSPESMRRLFESFPRLKDVYFIPYPENFIVHIVLRKLFRGMPGFLGMGTTPTDPYYFDEWGKVVDLTETYGVRMKPDWAKEFHSNSDSPPKVVIHPVGGISALDKSVRKMITPPELTEIVRAMNEEGIIPTLIGTPAEASYYHPLDLEIDIRRSYPFDEQMRLIASCNLLVGADSWAKTFAALCGKPAIVFQSLRGGTRSGHIEVADNIFLKPWPTITVVNNVSEMLNTFRQLYCHPSPRSTGE